MSKAIGEWSKEELQLSFLWQGSLKETVNEIEKQLIKLVLKEFKTKTGAAKILGVNRMTIMRKLKK